jgi:hypothetical protein
VSRSTGIGQASNSDIGGELTVDDDCGKWQEASALKRQKPAHPQPLSEQAQSALPS